MEAPTPKNLKIVGTISVTPVTTTVPQASWLYLIMGPTGAGKSSFIETLAGKSHKLSISSDQLSGYTQSVCAYQLINVFYQGVRGDYPVYLIDTPGFSDPNISEIEIMEMVRKWLNSNNLCVVNQILFLTPVTDVRLCGTRRRTIEMLKSLLKPSQDMRAMVFVTTMWNTLHNERTCQRAISNFIQMRDEIFKEFTGSSALITRFLKTAPSALHILDHYPISTDLFSTTAAFSNSIHLYQDLHERLEGALLQKHIIEMDLAQPETQTNSELCLILENSHANNEDNLVKLVWQFAHSVQPPDRHEVAYSSLREKISPILRGFLFHPLLGNKPNGCASDELGFDIMEQLSFLDVRVYNTVSSVDQSKQNIVKSLKKLRRRQRAQGISLWYDKKWLTARDD